MDIRMACEGDVKRLTNMVNNMYEELDYGVSFDEKWMLGRVKSRLFINAVVCGGEDIHAFCTVKLTANEYGGSDNGHMGFLYELYVEPDSRKKGYAGRLLKFMEQELVKLDIDYMELYVSKANEVGFDFWQSVGYREKYKVMAKKLKA
jgi:ribosomal protein S18 acetylase RimI-like enzyme